MSIEQIGRTTRLEAVNLILRNIGEREVTTLTNSTRGDVQAAVSELNQQSREVQDEGWDFNIEAETLTLSIDGRIGIPTNALTVRVVDTGTTDTIVQRGDFLYNITENTYVFTDELDTVVTSQLAFEELPEAARYYIAVRAARIVAQSRVGDPTVVQFTAGDEQYARYQIESRELEAGEYNALTAPGIRKLNNPHFR